MSVMISRENHTHIINRDIATLRALMVAPAAVVATLCLLWGMERLIHADENLQAPEQETYHVPDPVMVEPPPMEVLYARPERPELVETEPEIPELSVELTPPENGFLPLMAAVPTGIAPTIGEYFGDAPVATMLVQPSYPIAATNRGIEGYVDVEFDVTETGATTNIRVIAAEPPKIFEKETIKAVKRWKFNPVIRDGKPVPYKGMAQRVQFQMEKG